MNKKLAPIVVFSYNRPDHLERTLEALSKNDLANDSVLYIYCDGARPNATEEQKMRVEENRMVARAIAGFKEVHIVESVLNKGLSYSIINGVTEMLNIYGRVIVLEDDIVTSPLFLRYMNLALDYYEDRPSVMSISADSPMEVGDSIPADYDYDVFVSLRPTSWGWGTWKNRWERVDWSMEYLVEFLKHPKQIEAFGRLGDDMTPMLISQSEGKIDSWAIRFSFAHFCEHAVSIFPCTSYIENIGFDGTGVHCGNIEKKDTKDFSRCIENPRFLKLLYEDKDIVNGFYNKYCHKRRPLYQRVVNAIFRKMGKKSPFVIKKKVYE